MKTTPILGALSLAGMALAVPSGGHAHQNHMHKRDVVTQTAIVTTYEPDVMVFVDQHGNTLSRVTKTDDTPAPATTLLPEQAKQVSKPATRPASAQTTPSPAPAPEQPSSSAAAYVPSSPSSAAAPAAPTSSQSTPSSGSGSGSGVSSSSAPSGRGISYAPYTNTGDCKSADQVAADFASFTDYSWVRVYGTDCDQVPKVISAAAQHNKKVMLGVFEANNDAACAADVQKLVGAVNKQWSNVIAVSIGNEQVNSGQSNAAQMVGRLAAARPVLQAAGYNGPVVTVDTFSAVIANPTLCSNSDFAAVNAHAFFSSDVSASGAGAWLSSTISSVQNACPNKQVIVTESGWPWNGGSNGAAIPSTQNQKDALSSIKSAVSNVALFSAFDTPWKADNAYTFGCEKYWGIQS